MIPLADVHCHLLAGLDDGPQTWEDAVGMCKIAWEDGAKAIAATAHQNEHYPNVTAERILEATAELEKRLRSEQIAISVFPTAEVMISPSIEADLAEKKLLTVANTGRYLLVELPSGIFFDLRDMVTSLVEMGVRPILAHPERHPEFLQGNGTIEELILRGCVVQVSADSVMQDRYPQFAADLRSWARRNVIHLIGSDGHSTTRRPPGMSTAHSVLAQWTDGATADRICSDNGMAVFEGRPLQLPRPRPKRNRWFSRRA
jgi:protein-tyrosine phosphatase